MSTNLNQDSTELAQHFTNVAANYHSDVLFQSSSYQKWLNEIVFNALDLKRHHILVDPGCGSGKDCLYLLDKMNNEINVIANDISTGMIKILDDEINKQNLSNFIKTYCMDAVSFSQEKQLPRYHRLLLKQFIHLLSHEERLTVFKSFYEQFDSTDNKLLIIGRPRNEIFPFDKRTQDIFLSSIPPVDIYIKELEMCGFTNIQYDIYPYTFDDSITLDHWINVIKNRLWSIFSPEHMSDQQVADCISYLKEKYNDQKFQLNDEMLILHCTTKKTLA
ncbi:hypothetical protein I4U23_015694 [Adineta vaga]|nr:hypothetical protein I4U23_015694 [Adineta vaga]